MKTRSPFRVLSIDLALRNYDRMGFCVLEGKRKSSRAKFLKSSDLELQNPPDTRNLADAISKYCSEQEIRVVLLDGPQAWKDPTSDLVHCRRCEYELHTQVKTGKVGHVKPGPALNFVKFCIDLVEDLAKRGGELVSESPIRVKGRFLIVESFPTSAWRSLGMKTLPSPRKTPSGEIQRRLTLLRSGFGVKTQDEPTHDELQALIAGLAGLSILAKVPSEYCLSGSPPILRNGVRCEGYIVNPKISRFDKH
jgi:Protein of unknown function (DUF429)